MILEAGYFQFSSAVCSHLRTTILLNTCFPIGTFYEFIISLFLLLFTDVLSAARILSTNRT